LLDALTIHWSSRRSKQSAVSRATSDVSSAVAWSMAQYTLAGSGSVAIGFRTSSSGSHCMRGGVFAGGALPSVGSTAYGTPRSVCR